MVYGLDADESLEAPAEPKAKLQIRPSPGFTSWLRASGASLCFTTYEAGKVFLVGVASDGRLAVFERSFPRCMGVGVGEERLWVSSLYQITRFENFLDPGSEYEDFDAVFAPIEARVTGEMDIHDVHPEGAGETPVFVVTKMNCLARFDHRHSFAPFWKPPFISEIRAGDRCHLNGLAMREGAAAYVTCVAETDEPAGWRAQRASGGLVIDVATDETVARRLSMPHSPRLRDGALHILQSGLGTLGRIDLGTGAYEEIAFLPGFARGMAFVDGCAVVGVSRPRRQGAFDGLALDEALARREQEPVCMLAVVDLATGEIAHRLEISGVIRELYDVAALPGLRRPMLIGFRTDEVRRMVRPAPLGGA